MNKKIKKGIISIILVSLFASIFATAIAVSGAGLNKRVNNSQYSQNVTKTN